jgi:O-6-methylguanine DNA methyltransferase
VFLTDLGWFGLVGCGETVVALTIGHASAEAVRESLSSFPGPLSFPGSAWERTSATLRVASVPEQRSSVASDGMQSIPDLRSQAEPGNEDPGNDGVADEADWNPDLRRRLQAFAAGERCDFGDVRLALPALTAFQQRVVAETRQIGYGQRLTYGHLAERSGAPGAARAVGSVMSSNRLPILVPCHRVVASGGGLGGYSAPQGIDLKRRLLEMEASPLVPR